jgi:hypothetical protein
MDVPMEIEISHAVAIIRKSPNVGDEGIYRALVEAGFEQRLAARLVEFLPAAYCRVLFEQAGPRFSDTFQRRCRDGTISPPSLLASEPVWMAALEYARREVEKGISREDKLNVAGRSADFHAINDLLNGGSKLENVVLTPVVFQWPEKRLDGEGTRATFSKQWWMPWR